MHFLLNAQAKSVPDLTTADHIASNDSQAVRLCATAVALVSVPFVLSVSAILSRRTVRRILLATLVLNIPLQIEKHFFLQEDLASLGSIGGLQVSMTNIALIGLYFVWLIGIVLSRRSPVRLQFSLRGMTLPAALVFGFSAVSLLAAQDVTLGVFDVWITLVLFSLYLYVSRTTISREDLLFIVRLLLIGLIMQCVLMLAQANGIIGDIDWYGIKARAEFAGDSRVSGTIGGPNNAAAYLAMMIIFAVAVLLADTNRLDKLLAGTGVALCAASLVFTLSRGGWISVAVGIGMTVLCWRRQLPWKAFGLGAVLVLLIGAPLSGLVAGRLFNDDNGSSAARMPLNRLAAAMIVDHPLMGVGANNFAVAMQPYLASSFSGDFLYTVHNTYLLIWTETGIGGLIAFCWFLFAIILQGLKCWRLRDPLFAPLSLGCVAAVMGFMVQMNFDPFRSGSAVDLLWLLGALIFAMARMSRAPVAAKCEPDNVGLGRAALSDG
jgi:O-antigen ligase